MTEELLQLLMSNYLLYYYETDIVTGGDNTPQMVKQSVKVDKIGPKTYVINYVFFNRIIEHILSFDNDEFSVMKYLTNGHHYDEAHTNIYIPDSRLNAKNNIYGCERGDMVSSISKLCDMQVIKITKDNIDILSQIKDEINSFESYNFIQQAVLDGEMDLYVAMNSIGCAGYMHTIVKYNGIINKKIMEPAIYTCESQRLKGIASDMLSRLMKGEYSECCILYEVAPENIASNNVAKKIGLSYLGTKYRYVN